MPTIKIYNPEDNFALVDSASHGSLGSRGIDFDGHYFFVGNVTYIRKYEISNSATFAINEVDALDVVATLDPTATTLEVYALCVDNYYLYFAYNYQISIGNPPAIMIGYKVWRCNFDFTNFEQITTIAGYYGAANPVLSFTHDGLYWFLTSRGTGSGTTSNFARIDVGARGGPHVVENLNVATGSRYNAIAWNGINFYTLSRAGQLLIVDDQRNLLHIGPGFGSAVNDICCSKNMDGTSGFVGNDPVSNRFGTWIASCEA